VDRARLVGGEREEPSSVRNPDSDLPGGRRIPQDTRDRSRHDACDAEMTTALERRCRRRGGHVASAALDGVRTRAGRAYCLLQLLRQSVRAPSDGLVAARRGPLGRTQARPSRTRSRPRRVANAGWRTTTRSGRIRIRVSTSRSRGPGPASRRPSSVERAHQRLYHILESIRHPGILRRSPPPRTSGVLPRRRAGKNAVRMVR
jgi:hypothetical protein